MSDTKKTQPIAGEELGDAEMEAVVGALGTTTTTSAAHASGSIV